MSEIESIRYFQDLYDRFADNPGEVYWARIHSQTTREAIETALTALCEKVERNRGCFWCSGDVLLDNVKINGVAVNISCCPMCGKRLGVEG